jgi:aspartate aminotransferase
VIADEAYEDVVYDGAAHVSMGSLDGMYPRTVGVYTFSKSYAMTGLRLGYVTVQDAVLRERARKALFMTVSNVASIVQYGGIGALEGSQDSVAAFRRELQARRDLFYEAVGGLPGTPFAGEPPRGAFYAFLRISPAWQPRPDAHPQGVPASRSWAIVEELIGLARVGCVPGVDFGAQGENHVRFCFARERAELEGAIASMRAMFDGSA